MCTVVRDVTLLFVAPDNIRIVPQVAPDNIRIVPRVAPDNIRIVHRVATGGAVYKEKGFYLVIEVNSTHGTIQCLHMSLKSVYTH